MVSTEIVAFVTVSRGRRFRPSLVGAVDEASRAEEKVWKACRFIEQHLQLLLLKTLSERSMVTALNFPGRLLHM